MCDYFDIRFCETKLTCKFNIVSLCYGYLITNFLVDSQFHLYYPHFLLLFVPIYQFFITINRVDAVVSPIRLYKVIDD